MSACLRCHVDHAEAGLSPGAPCSRVEAILRHRAGQQAAQQLTEQASAVNAPQPAVNTRRGAYPATDLRRVYMRTYMRARRAEART